MPRLFALYASKGSHTEEEWTSGAVRCHVYDDEAFLADAKGNNVVVQAPFDGPFSCQFHSTVL